MTRGGAGIATLLAVVALAAPAAAADLPAGTSGWLWSSPRPQGMALRDVGFAGETGYAVGIRGTLLKSTDSGQRWETVRYPGDLSLGLVDVVDPSNVVAVSECAVIRSTDGGAHFATIHDETDAGGGCSRDVIDVSFTSPAIGYLLENDGTPLATSDGGTHFATRAAVPGSAAAHGRGVASSIAFLDGTTGMAAEGRKLYRTDDGARSWTLVTSAPETIDTVRFASASRGYAVGLRGLLLRTDDGGRTWTPEARGSATLDYEDIRCATPDVCIVNAFSKQTGEKVLLRTTNGGATMTRTALPSHDSPYESLAFASATRVIAVDSDGAMARSNDGGAHFSSLVSSPLSPNPPSALAAGLEPGSAFAYEFGISRTTDGGQTWQNIEIENADVIGVSFPAPAVGYALGVDGHLFRTANAGRTWRRERATGERVIPPRRNHPLRRGANAVYAPSARTVLLFGPRGVFRSHNDGRDFAASRSRAVAHRLIKDVAWARGARIVAWGPSTLARSTNGGRTWRRMPTPGTRPSIWKAAFISPRTGLLVDGKSGAFHLAWKTTDAGRHWHLLRGIAAPSIGDVEIGSLHDMYAIGDGYTDDFLLHSADGGATWQPELSRFDDSLDEGSSFTVAAGPDGRDYLLVAGNDLLTTTTGGSAGTRSTLALTTPRRRLRRPATIVVRGQLRPARAGAPVTVRAMLDDANGPVIRSTKTATDGSFRTCWRVPDRRPTFAPSGRVTNAIRLTFVARWEGDETLASAGSRALTVAVHAPRRRGKYAFPRPVRCR